MPPADGCWHQPGVTSSPDSLLLQDRSKGLSPVLGVLGCTHPCFRYALPTAVQDMPAGSVSSLLVPYEGGRGLGSAVR